jgi:hypothetical protein
MPFFYDDNVIQTSIARAVLESLPPEPPPLEAPVFELPLLPPEPEPSEQAAHKREKADTETEFAKFHRWLKRF